MRHNAAAVASSMSSSPKLRSTGTSSPRNGAIRLPEAAPITAQQLRSATITSSPYLGGRGVRGRTILTCSACRSALRA